MDNLLKRIIILEALFLGSAIHNSSLSLESFLFQYIMTKEELRKAKRAVYMKAYNEANKEALKEYKSSYYQKNKEVLSKKAKVYNKDNKVAIADNSKEYRRVNRDSIRSQRSGHYHKNNLTYNVVYCIPNYDGLGNNYAGVTHNTHYRMIQHKAQGKLNTSEWYELGRCDCRKEAEALEDAFHKLGYHGHAWQMRGVE